MLSIILLLMIFLKYNKLNLSELPTVPAGIKYFIGLLFVTLFISTVFSESVTISLLADFKTVVFFTLVYLFSALLTKLDSLIYIHAIFLSVFILTIAIMFQIVNAGFTIFIMQGALARFMLKRLPRVFPKQNWRRWLISIYWQRRKRATFIALLL